MSIEVTRVLARASGDGIRHVVSRLVHRVGGPDGIAIYPCALRADSAGLTLGHSAAEPMPTCWGAETEAA